jgi:hypothetical protein
MKVTITVFLLCISLFCFSQDRVFKGSEWQIKTEVPFGLGASSETVGMGIMASYFASNDFGFNFGLSYVNTTVEYYYSNFGYDVYSYSAFPITLGLVKRWAVSRSVIEPYVSVNYRLGSEYGRSMESVVGAEFNWTPRLASYAAFGMSTQNLEPRFFTNSGFRYSFGFH